MKKFLLAAIVVSSVFISCKKDNPAPTCETTVAGITANYRITKVELVASGGTSDVSSTYLDDCKRNAIYQLKADRSLIYTETASTCSDSDTGSWNVINGKLSMSGTAFDVNDATISTWDCSTMKVSTNFGGASLVYTFVKQ